MEKFNLADLNKNESLNRLKLSLSKLLEKNPGFRLIGIMETVQLPDTPGKFRFTVELKNGIPTEIYVEDYADAKTKTVKWDDLSSADKEVALQKIETKGIYK
jgi:hypothetical protein